MFEPECAVSSQKLGSSVLWYFSARNILVSGVASEHILERLRKKINCNPSRNKRYVIEANLRCIPFLIFHSDER